MKRFIFYSFLLYLGVNLWSSTASAATYTFQSDSEASAACQSYIATVSQTTQYRCLFTAQSIAQAPRYNSQFPTSSGWGNAHTYRFPGTCPSGRYWDFTQATCIIDNRPPPAPICTSDTIPGFGLYGSNPTGDVITIGDTGPRIANVNSCAYTCYVNYDLLDGFTTFGAAHQCTGLSQAYVDQEPSSYTDPNVCSVRDNLGRCLELAQQSGPCAAGTTYGRVNDIEVCVPSGTSTAAADEGSTGVPDAGGSQQATGTADVAGTGGLSTGSGTSTSTSSSTTTVNPDGTSTTEGTETEESSGPKTFGGHGDPKSWWVSKYPAGVSGIADNFSYSVQTSAIMDVLNPLTSLPNSGSEPVWSMSFNLGPLGNYGVSDFRVPEGVWLFVRFCLFFTATFVAQRIVFGGG
jgi:hypothetical protein